MEQMYKDIKSGRRGDFDVKDYYHNRVIEKLFYTARRKAWSSISQQEKVRSVILEQREREIARIQKRQDTANIINIPK